MVFKYSQNFFHPSSPPRIHLGLPGNQTVFTGQNVTMKCDAEVRVSSLSEIAQIHWERYNQTSDSFYRISNGTKSLILANVNETDSGIYRCVADNAFGTDKANGTLTVLYKNPIYIWLSKKLVVPVLIFGLVLILSIFYLSKIRSQTSTKRLIPIIDEQKLPPILCSQEPIDQAQENLYRRLTIKCLQAEINAIRKSPGSEEEKHLLQTIDIPPDPMWEINRDNINILDRLDAGFFGQVFRAELTDVYHDFRGRSKPVIAAVKMLKQDAVPKDVSDLFAEIQVLKRVSNPKHKNIINLVGTCTQNGPIFVVLEYAENGNLRDFLRDYRSKAITQTHMKQDLNFLQLTPGHLNDFATQIAYGMEYLHAKNVVHRDLASRNILVTGDLVMKVADFGLARDVTENDYYRKKGPTQLPWKWMSIEALMQYWNVLKLSRK